ncbi:uncharacterized protein LOC110987173 isoform X2 [Acanthaster planci]|uniref:Uncharacterized protein LOC110987173 isoform X2 n=1 Tax=Acanthaster planci TaxID=133434 RepID=A0A8B7ZKZ7_ACAPL|nr:uncharacterized protein LOC110987173 isoform X2 [Acanthaster planci]
MAFSSVLQMYLGWANSLLCEQGILIDGLHQLRSGTIFCNLIELLTGSKLLPADQDALSETDDSVALDNVQVALDFLTGIGVKMAVSAEGVVCGELKSILDVMWSIILHCTVHSPERAAYQRTVRIGRKLLLQWCGEELAVSIDTSQSMAAVFSGNNLLSDLLSLHCSFENIQDARDKYLVNLTNGILAAEDHFGISKTLLGPADVVNGTADEHSLMIYISLLKRKVSLLVSSSLSSDEDEFIKISPHKPSPSTSVLSAANSVYSGRSSLTNLSHHSTPQPPHHRYSLDYSTFSNRTPSFDTSLTRGTNQDVTPEKSDSGISMTADPPASLPSGPSSRLKELRDHTPDSQKMAGAAYGATLDRTDQSKQIRGISRITAATSLRRHRAMYVERQHEHLASHERDSQVREKVGSVHRSASSGLLFQNASRCEEQRKEDVISKGSRQAVTEESSGSNNETKMKEGPNDGSRNPLKRGDELVQTPDDELLNLLDTIGEESQHLRLELTETQLREAILKTQLEEGLVGSTKEERVISKLVQELEMLREENRRLFRESANAKNGNAVDRKTMEKLNATIRKLQMEVEHQSSENFNLRMKSKVGSDLSSLDTRPESDIFSLESGAKEKVDKVSQSDYSSELKETPELCDLKRDLARAESQKEFLQARLKEMEEKMVQKLDQTTDDLKVSRLENLRLEKECKLLRMSSETSRLEVETVVGRCRRLEEYLSQAQKRNARLTQQLEEDALEVSSQGRYNQSLASVAKLKEENALMREKVELAEEERELLKKELAHYRQNKTTLDEVLRAWDIQTSSKFQSFLDDFRLRISEQREHQEAKIAKDLARKGQSVENNGKEFVRTETQVGNDVSRSSRSVSSVENSEQGSEGQETLSSVSRESSRDSDLQETKLLTEENLAAVANRQAAVDDKYLQFSPRRSDTETEVDSEMDSQATENAFSDLPNEHMVAAGGITKTKLSDGIRRPSLGDLIVAKAQNSPDDNDTRGQGTESYHSESMSVDPNNEKAGSVSEGEGKNSGATSTGREASRGMTTDLPRSHLSSKTRFSAVNSSLESLKGITKKAKLNPARETTQNGDSEVTVLQPKRRDEDRLTVPLKSQDDKDTVLKAGGDNVKDLEYAHTHSKIANEPTNSDPQNLPEIQPSFTIHERVGPVRGRFSRWRRMQNRPQPDFDGSYLDGSRLRSDLPKGSLEPKLDMRNRSSSLGSLLNSSSGWKESSKQSVQFEGSETATNSFESEEEFARLPERRNIAQGGTIGKGRVDAGSEKPPELGKGNCMDETKILANGHRAEGDGSDAKPQFASPQRLGNMRSKFGIKLEKELLGSSRSFSNSLANEPVAASSIKGTADLKLANGNRPSEILPTSQVASIKPGTMHSSAGDGDEQSNSSDIMTNANEGNTETENDKSVSASNSTSPDVSKMSPASYNRYYKHKMMAEKDQEYANSIIDKYLNIQMQ